MIFPLIFRLPRPAFKYLRMDESMSETQVQKNQQETQGMVDANPITLYRLYKYVS